MKKFEIIGNRWIRFVIEDNGLRKEDTYDLEKVRYFSSTHRRLSPAYLLADINFYISNGVGRNIKYHSDEEDQFHSDKKSLEEIFFKASPAFQQKDGSANP